MEFGSIIMWIIFGAIVGWIASMVMKTDAEQGASANTVVGIIGAFLIGWFNTSLTGDEALRCFKSV